MTKKRPDYHNRPWGTLCELDFIDSLGAKGDRLFLLKKYAKAASLRTEWGKMNRGKIINHVNEAIKQESGLTRN